MAILVTGGAGYIGSHRVLALLERGGGVVVLNRKRNVGVQKFMFSPTAVVYGTVEYKGSSAPLPIQYGW